MNMRSSERGYTGRVALALVMLAVPAVEAHVTVLPREATAKSAPELTLRVPNEKDVPTESLRVEFPPELQVLRFKPTAGWDAEVERDAAGRIVAVTYTGALVRPQEYQEFSFIARLPEQTGPVRLKAYQRYAGGVEVAWVNDAEPQPAPLVTVMAAQTATAPGADAFAAPAAAAAPASSASETAPSGGSAWVGAAALAISVLAVILALRPRHGRPTT